MRCSMSIMTTSGDVVHSDSEEMDDSDGWKIDRLTEILENFSEMRHLSMNINGEAFYFNPANIVWAKINRSGA